MKSNLGYYRNIYTKEWLIIVGEDIVILDDGIKVTSIWYPFNEIGMSDYRGVLI